MIIFERYQTERLTTLIGIQKLFQISLKTSLERTNFNDSR